ncbi:MAG: Lrp/AsnC family transcriptional regulator [Alphaproteobacteria bacterium]|nr:Lrp/AsnC family transcriptional regulator [Alphaproteobacteria bacterium]
MSDTGSGQRADGKSAEKRKVKLDAIDRRILRNLRDEGRITNVELARRAGISAPPCLRRVRALESAGFIKAYHAELDAELLGYEVAFHALVGLDSQSEAVLTEFERQMRTWPEVRRCDMIRGGGDFMLRIVARNTAHENELTSRLTAAPHVSTVQTFQVIRSSKYESSVPVDDPDE